MIKNKFNTLAFDDDQINDELVDALIKAGSHEYIQNSTLEILDEELSDIEFSEELDKKLNEYFNSLEKEDRKSKVRYIANKTKSIALRAAAVLLVLIVLATGFVATSEAAQLKLLHMYIEHSDIDSEFAFEDMGDNTKNPKKQRIDSLESLFWYIPEGFELVYEDHTDTLKTVFYENASGNYIDIMQSTDGNLKIDTEQAHNYTIEVGEHVCFVTEREGKITVVFKIDEYNYTITTDIPLDEVIKIVENINY